MARDFTFSNDEYLYTPAAVVVSAPFTHAIWFRKNNASEACCLIGHGDTSVSNQSYRLSSYSTTVEEEARSGTTVGANASYTVTADEWTHACGIEFTSNSRKVFANGTTTGTDNGTRTPSGLDETRLGSRSQNSVDDTMDGQLAYGAIWNVGLTDAEVLLLSRRCDPRLIRYNNLVCYWPLDGKTFPEPDLALGQNFPLYPSSGDTITAFPSPLLYTSVPIPISARFVSAHQAAAPGTFVPRCVVY